MQVSVLDRHQYRVQPHQRDKQGGTVLFKSPSMMPSALGVVGKGISYNEMKGARIIQISRVLISD